MQSENVTLYKFRAECVADAQAVRAVLLPWVLKWSERRTNMDVEGTLYVMSDVEVEFTVTVDAPALNEMIWLVDAIDNCHVASQSLAVAELYTGDRDIRETFDSPAQRPSDAVLHQARAAACARQKILDAELARVRQLHRVYDSVVRLGDNWKPFGGARPGWLVVEQHRQSGVASVRNVHPPLGCKNWKKLGDGIVMARMLMLRA